MVCFAVPDNPVTITITRSGSATIGHQYTLECQVSAIPGLANTAIATWHHHNLGSPVTTGGGITISPNTPSTSSTLTFTILSRLHAGEYTCEGKVESPALPDSPKTIRETQNVTVKSKLF